MTEVTDPFIARLYKTSKTRLQYSKKIQVLIFTFIYFILIIKKKVYIFESVALKFDEEKSNEFYNRCAWHRFSH